MKSFLDFEIYPMKLYCDNSAAIKCSKTDGSKALRHAIEIRSDYLEGSIKDGMLQVEWVFSSDQLADIFTKPLSFRIYERLTNEILSNE